MDFNNLGFVCSINVSKMVVCIDNSYIQEQHFRINDALRKFEPGSTCAMWAILQGLYLIDDNMLDINKPIPNTKIKVTDIDTANECEFYIAFTQKTAAYINSKVVPRSQMFAHISFVKSELYKAYSKYISVNYGNDGINFITNTNYLGGK